MKNLLKNEQEVDDANLIKYYISSKITISKSQDTKFFENNTELKILILTTIILRKIS